LSFQVRIAEEKVHCRREHILHASVCVFGYLVSNNGDFYWPSATGASQALDCDRMVLARTGLTHSAERI